MMENIDKGKINNFNQYSEEVTEVLTSTPNSIFYVGNTVIALVIILLLFLTWLIKFPDIINTEAQLSSVQIPIKLFSTTSGNLEVLNVKDGEWVKKDSILAILTNNEKLQEITILKDVLQKIKLNVSSNNIIDIELPSNLNIGTFTPSYAEIKSLHYSLIKTSNEFAITKEFKKIQSQLLDIQKMKKILSEEHELLLKQITLIDKNNTRQEMLLADGVISKYDLEQSEFELMDIRTQEKRVKYRIFDLDATAKNLQRQQTALLNSDRRGLSEIKLEIFSLVEQLLAQIELWEFNHIIKAPFSGICSYIEVLSENQFIPANSELFYVSPNINEIQVRGNLPIAKSGLVQKGQKVILKLKSYPYREFGTLTATLDHISYMANENGYHYVAKLDSQLVTSYGKEIVFKPLMGAEGEIIIEDSRLIERIFNEIKNIFKN